MQKHQCKLIYASGLIVLVMAFLGFMLRAASTNVIIDAHEHIEDFSRAEVLKMASGEAGITKTILVASPTETLSLNGSKSFTGYRENMEELLRIAKTYPKRFIAFCTLNPLDSDVMEYLQKCYEDGGKGLKLYNGHSYYYDIFGIPLDSPRMMPIYAFAERNKMPLLFHVNIVKYEGELRRVLDKHPDLVVSVPHFMVSSIDLTKVESLLDHYPNLYTDISFGSTEFLAAGLRRISKDPGKYAEFINNYQDRILFGADMVLTTAEEKDQTFMEARFDCYRNLLEKRRFQCGPVSSYYEDKLSAHQQSYQDCEPKEGAYCESLMAKVDVYQKRFDEVVNLSGLSLSSAVLNKIYHENAERYLKAEPAGI